MRLAELHEAFDRYAIHDLANPTDSEVEKVDKIDDLAARIKAHCGTMLKAYQDSGLVLYRGIQGHSKEQVIITGIRPNRKPVEMESRLHNALEIFFQEQGLTVNRSNGLFTSRRLGNAGDWGGTYVVFIKDGWTGLVFDGMSDDYSFYHLQRIAELAIKGRDDEAEAKFAALKPREFKSSSELADVLEHDFMEVLFSGDSYIAVKADGPVWKALKKKLDIT